MYNTHKLCGEDPAEGINRRLFRYEEEDSMKKQKISDAVIHRLPRYYRYLDDLYNKGVVRISSSSLGDKMDITASQIRQDLSCFGEFGQQGYGYNVAELRAEIGHILGIDNGHRLIIIGVGHLGHALLQNFDFEKVGFQVDSAFDVSPALVDTQIRGVTIRPMDQLAEYVARYRPNRTWPSPWRTSLSTWASGASGTSPTWSCPRRSPACSLRTSTLWTPC